MNLTLKAIRCEDFDDKGLKAVVLDIYDTEGNYIEQGNDWSYFETEQDAQKYIKNFNNNIKEL